MISEESSDTEDTEEKFTFTITEIKYILKYTKAENSYFKS